MPAKLDLQLDTISRIRLFPEPVPSPSSTPLSILDATVLRFSPTGAIWVYRRAPPLDNLILSLKETLNAYPQWAGQLHWSPYNPLGGHTQRRGRLMLTYGTEADPGVEYSITRTSCPLSSLHLDEVNGYLDAGSFPSAELLNSVTPLAFHDAIEFQGLPCMIVQVTSFADGGAAIGVKLAHVIADAQTLLHFMNDWASMNRAIMANTSRPILSPVFDPLMLDRTAAGDIDAMHPDSALLEISHHLSLHRYDCWASADRCPTPLSSITHIPPMLKPEDIEPMGNPIPWSNWDATAPVAYYLVNFEADELQAMWDEACSIAKVSHLDALLAHVWRSIARARGLGEDEDHYFDISFGFRNRLDPPLPPSYLGSPLTVMKVSSRGCQADLGELALSIRSTLKTFNPSTLPALLHELAFEVGAQRTWCAFYGRCNTIITSWLQLGIREVDFGTGVPAYTEAMMPNVDGCVQLMEAKANINHSGSHTNVRWYDSGVTLSLHLREDVMQRFLKDPLLRKYQKNTRDKE